MSVLVGWKSFAATPAFFTAIAAGLMAALLYAIAAPYAKRQLSGVPPLVIATMSQLSTDYRINGVWLRVDFVRHGDRERSFQRFTGKKLTQ